LDHIYSIGTQSELCGSSGSTSARARLTADESESAWLKSHPVALEDYDFDRERGSGNETPLLDTPLSTG
jgi:hypothetical protein